jgi:hypothetical protein
MKNVIIALLVLVSLKMTAQPYTVENGNTRHRFAQMELGVTQYFSPNAGKTQALSETGKISDFQFGANFVSAIFIGATHFWGHCDLALTIPIKQFGEGMKYGVDLQMKYYPWRIERNKLRPYIGVSMNPFGYAQNNGLISAMKISQSAKVIMEMRLKIMRLKALNRASHLVGIFAPIGCNLGF